MSEASWWTPKLRVLLVFLLIALPLDQATKGCVDATLAPGERWVVVEGFFSITHARNPGAAFGLLRDWPDPWRSRVLFASAALALWVIVLFFFRLAPGERFAAGALGLVLGGGLGNFIDRMLRGDVIDLLYLQMWEGYPWPEFNLADVFIVLGVGALIVELVSVEGRARSAEELA